ncbi:hypothetical protein NL676_009837 [Syzygium grande]|nr:hypothetical protein NL676_009837 [Syzygium grande]
MQKGKQHNRGHAREETADHEDDGGGERAHPYIPNYNTVGITIVWHLSLSESPTELRSSVCAGAAALGRFGSSFVPRLLFFERSTDDPSLPLTPRRSVASLVRSTVAEARWALLAAIALEVPLCSTFSPPQHIL